MGSFIDVVKGEIHVGNLSLTKDMTFAEIIKAGFVFVRELDMKTGWVFRISKPYFLDEREAVLSLEFFEDTLKAVSFSFVEEGPALKFHEVTMEYLSAIYKRQNEILFCELGRPDVQSSERTTYNYHWGLVSSVIDLKSWSCSVMVSWVVL